MQKRCCAGRQDGVTFGKRFGGELDDFSTWIIPVSDEGYIIVGDRDKNGLIIKLDNQGEIEWQKSLGGNGGDILWSIVPAPEKGTW